MLFLEDKACIKLPWKANSWS